MRVFIHPRFGKESGQGGIKRVVEAQHKWLPEYGVEIVDNIKKADLIAVHADEYNTDLPTAYHCHGLYWEGYDWPNWCYEANSRIINSMKKAAGVSVPSQFVHHALSRGMLLNPAVLYHGVDFEEWEPGENEGYVLWAKNRPDPICDPTPINMLAKSCPELEFITTFGTPYDNVRVVGKLLYQESKVLLQKAGAYLATVQETGGITLLEAMACGVPPVGFNFGVNSEIIQHKVNGYIVEPGDYAGLREGVHYVLANRDELGANARDTVRERFQWKDRIQDYVPFYKEVLENGSRTSPKISVIITAYNLDKYLRSAVDSVLKQDYEDWELIIVDDASPDDCGKIADEYARSNPKVRVIHNSKNVYLAEARNIGIRNSRGKYIIPLDADDRLGPSTLRSFSQTLDEDKDVDIVTGDFWLLDDGQTEPWLSGWPPKNPSFNQQILRRNQVYYASMYRRWVWERTGGYRRRMKSAEDAEFWTRAMSYGANPVKVTGFPSLLYSNRPSSMSHSIATPEWNEWFIWAMYPEFTPFGASGTPPYERPAWPVLSYGPEELTVVIPVGPGHDWYLQDCLDSLVAQTMQNWRAVVVNDTGVSWYENGKLTNPYLSGYPFVTIIDSEGPARGPAWARNRGIQEVKTDAFVLLDADDIAQPLLLDVLYKAWKEYGGWCYTDWMDQEGTHKYAQDWDGEAFIQKMLGPITGIYSKEAWEVIGGFDEKLKTWEDWDFQISLFEVGECGLRLAFPGFTYRYHTGTRRESGFAQKDKLLNYIRNKHAKLYEDRNFFMACSSCGGSRNTISIGASANAESSSPDMLLIEYTGPQKQEARIRSRVRPSISYEYFQGRKFYIYKGDEWILNNRDFQLAAIPQIQADQKIEAPVLKAETREPAVQQAVAQPTAPSQAQPLSVDVLNLPSLVKGILKREGFDTVDMIEYAEDVELLTAKGISDARLKQIRKAVNELQR